MNKRSLAPGAGVCRARRLLRLDRKKMTSADNRKSEQYDAWYVKVVFGVFLCVSAFGFSGSETHLFISGELQRAGWKRFLG